MKTIHREQRNPGKQKSRKERPKNKVVALARTSWKIFWQKQSFVLFLYDLLGIVLAVALLVGGAVLVKWTYLGFTPTAKLAFETAQAINVNPNQVTAFKDQISTIKLGLYRWIAGMIFATAAMLVIPLVTFSVSSFFSASKLVESLKTRQSRLSWKQLGGTGALGMFLGILFLCISLLTALVLRPPVNAIIVLVLFFIFVVWWLVALYEFIITKRVLHSLVFFWTGGCKDILFLC
ncbi:hypothetical protein HY772_07440 [Candidatus Woesearchaeota archaeon]|nr:hypothetical protein [Candidatus Woesearchaeota archaeon]